MAGGGWRVDERRPRPGRHYPSRQVEFEEWFRSEASAAAYIEDVRFRHGRRCPDCDEELRRSGERRFWCSHCRKHLSLTAGTLLQGTRVPLRTWLGVCWLMTQSKPGVSAMSISRAYGLRYNTAWTLLHKIRHGMDQTGRQKLTGYVEIDECLIGGREPGLPGGIHSKKHTVVVAVEIPDDETGLGRIRMARTHDATIRSLKGFIRTYIEPGTILHSDGLNAYVQAVNQLHAEGLTYPLHQTVQHGNPNPADQLLPHVHRVISLLKRWLLGTYQGGAQSQHLDTYLDEFVFRFNRRRSGSRGLLFWRLICMLTDTPGAVRYTELRARNGELLNAERQHVRELHEDTKARNSAKNSRRYRRRKARDQGLDPDIEVPREKDLHPDLVVDIVDPF